jgi:hypothetical protein
MTSFEVSFGDMMAVGTEAFLGFPPECLPPGPPIPNERDQTSNIDHPFNYIAKSTNKTSSPIIVHRFAHLNE